MNKDNHYSSHRWICEDTPGYYICKCGTTGVWNSELERVEVLEPIPYDSYIRKHNIIDKTIS